MLLSCPRSPRSSPPVRTIVAVLLAACGGDPSGPDTAPPPGTPTVTVALNAGSVALVQGGTQQLGATVSGTTNTTVSWSTSNPLVASVANGLVSAVGVGSATITATAAADPTKQASATVTVSAPNTGGGAPTLTSGVAVTGIAAVEDQVRVYRIVVPAGATRLEVITTGPNGDLDLYLARTANPTAGQFLCSSEGFDSNERCTVNNPASGEWFALLSAFEAFTGATVTATITGGGSGGGGTTPGYSLAITPTSASVAAGGSAQYTVTIQRDAGFTAGVTLVASGLPSGVTPAFTPSPATGTTSTLTLTTSAAAAAGTTNFVVTGTANGLPNRTAAGSITITTSGGGGGATLTWQQISVGGDVACGIATNGNTYCWGDNASGALGIGTFAQPPNQGNRVPNLVTGGHSFTSITTGTFHACALTSDGTAYCWGGNSAAELGTGDATNRNVPTPVAGGLRFQSITARGRNTCGVTTTGAAYCWGQSGAATGVAAGGAPGLTTPRLIPGGITFQRLFVGSNDLVCGLTPANAAYCWGDSNYGQVGAGTSAFTGGATSYASPQAVIGGLVFTSLDLGTAHACGTTAGGALHCWGWSNNGQVGVGPAGNNTIRDRPTQVATGVSIQQAAAYGASSCARSAAGTTYCWGLGSTYHSDSNLLFTQFTAPTLVPSGGQVFTTISMGQGTVCGITAAGAGWCWGRETTMGSGDTNVNAAAARPISPPR